MSKKQVTKCDFLFLIPVWLESNQLLPIKNEQTSKKKNNDLINSINFFFVYYAVGEALWGGDKSAGSGPESLPKRPALSPRQGCTQSGQYRVRSFVRLFDRRSTLLKFLFSCFFTTCDKREKSSVSLRESSPLSPVSNYRQKNFIESKWREMKTRKTCWIIWLIPSLLIFRER